MDDEAATATEDLRPPAVPAAPPVGPRALLRRAPVIPLIASILVALVLAESVVLFRSNATERARTEVLDTSRRFLTLLLTYNPSTLEAQQRKVLAMSTGRFRSDYQAAAPTLLNALKETEADARATVLHAAVSSVRGDAATVLAVVRVTTTNKSLPAPRVEQNVIELSLVLTTRGWRIDAVNNLGRLAV